MAPLSPSVSLPSRPRSPPPGPPPSRLRRDSRSPPPAGPPGAGSAASAAAVGSASSSRWRENERYDDRPWTGGRSYGYRDPPYGAYRPRERSPSPRRYRDDRDGDRHWDGERYREAERYRDGGRGVYRARHRERDWDRDRERDADRRLPDRDRRFDADVSFKQRYRSPSPRRAFNRSPSPLASSSSSTAAGSHRPTPSAKPTPLETPKGAVSEKEPEREIERVTPDPEIEEGELDSSSVDKPAEGRAGAGAVAVAGAGAKAEGVPPRASLPDTRLPSSGPRAVPGRSLSPRERERDWERGSRPRRFRSPSPDIPRGPPRGPEAPGSDWRRRGPHGSRPTMAPTTTTTSNNPDERTESYRPSQGQQTGRGRSRTRSRSRSVSRSRASSSSRSRTSRSRSSSTTRSDVREGRDGRDVRDDVGGRVAGPVPPRIPTGPMGRSNRGRWGATDRTWPRQPSGWERAEGDRERSLAAESERERDRVRERDRREMELVEGRRRQDQTVAEEAKEKEKGADVKPAGQPLGGKEWAERMKLLEERKAKKAEAEAASRVRDVLEPSQHESARPTMPPTTARDPARETRDPPRESREPPSETKEAREAKEQEGDVWRAARLRMERDGRERERLERERERLDRVLARLTDRLVDRLESERKSWGLRGDDDPELTKLRATFCGLANDGVRVSWELWQSRQELTNGELDLTAFEDRRRLAEASSRRGV